MISFVAHILSTEAFRVVIGLMLIVGTFTVLSITATNPRIHLRPARILVKVSLLAWVLHIALLRALPVAIFNLWPISPWWGLAVVYVMGLTATIWDSLLDEDSTNHLNQNRCFGVWLLIEAVMLLGGPVFPFIIAIIIASAIGLWFLATNIYWLISKFTPPILEWVLEIEE